jgi:predicted GIY-YIG superfamily endonuclease
MGQPEQFYAGLTSEVSARLAAHNAGQSPHISKYRLWRLIASHYFADQAAAVTFERYPKSGSGRAFANRHLR